MAFTLGDRLSQRETDGFVGRRDELRLFEEALSGRLDRSVLIIHGPPGVGKTALLRAMRRRAAELRREVRLIDGIGRGLAEPFAAPFATLRPVVLVDHADDCAGTLRDIHLPLLPERALIVIAGRRPFNQGWLSGGWERVALELPLREFDDTDGLALLSGCGVVDNGTCRQILAFAEGSPLSLVVAAGAVRAGRDARIERDRVLAELGVDALTDPHAEITVDVVRQALKCLKDPLTLAETPLARGVSPTERADHARTVLLLAMRQAFADGGRDDELQIVIERRYLEEPEVGHDLLARRLLLSRATYFRRLQEGIVRITAWLRAEADEQHMAAIGSTHSAT